jgi:Uma2 family endonuclease
VWVVDLVNDSVEVYREPDRHGYRQIQRYGRGQVLTPSAFPDIQIPVDDILGPA